MGHSDKIDKVPVLMEVGTADNKQENRKLSEIETIYHSNMQLLGMDRKQNYKKISVHLSSLHRKTNQSHCKMFELSKICLRGR